MGEALVVVSFVVVLAERLVQALKPVVDPFLLGLEKWLKLPPGWGTMVWAWLLTSGLVALTKANLFTGYIPEAWAGQVLTVIVAGGGANLLHDIWPVRTTKA